MKGKHVKSENIIKKIVCMVVVFMMMTSNLMTPVTILASDLNESEIEQTSGINDGNNAGESVDTESSNSEIGWSRGFRGAPAPSSGRRPRRCPFPRSPSARGS